jgi:hypothetical protein
MALTVARLPPPIFPVSLLYTSSLYQDGDFLYTLYYYEKKLKISESRGVDTRLEYRLSHLSARIALCADVLRQVSLKTIQFSKIFYFHSLPTENILWFHMRSGS